MRFRQLFVELQRLNRCSVCFRHEIVRFPLEPCAHERIGIRQACICARIVRIFIYSSLEVVRSLIEAGPPLVPEIHAPQIEVIGFVGMRASFCSTQWGRFMLTQRKLNFVSDLLSDLGLDAQ